MSAIETWKKRLIDLSTYRYAVDVKAGPIEIYPDDAQELLLLLEQPQNEISRLQGELERYKELMNCVEDVAATAEPYEDRFTIGAGQGIRLVKAWQALQETPNES